MPTCDIKTTQTSKSYKSCSTELEYLSKGDNDLNSNNVLIDILTHFYYFYRNYAIYQKKKKVVDLCPNKKINRNLMYKTYLH